MSLSHLSLIDWLSYNTLLADYYISYFATKLTLQQASAEILRLLYVLLSVT